MLQKKSKIADGPPDELGETPETCHFERIKGVNPLRLIFHSVCCKFGRNRTERILERGRARLAQDRDIVEFIKQFRECMNGMKTQKEHSDLVRMPMLESESEIGELDS